MVTLYTSFRFILPGISVFFGVLGQLTPNPLVTVNRELGMSGGTGQDDEPAQPAQPGDQEVLKGAD